MAAGKTAAILFPFVFDRALLCGFFLTGMTDRALQIAASGDRCADWLLNLRWISRGSPY